MRIFLILKRIILRSTIKGPFHMNDKKHIMSRRSSRQIFELRTIQTPTPSPQQTCRWQVFTLGLNRSTPCRVTLSPEHAHVEPVMDTIVPTDAVLTQRQALTGTRTYFTILTSRYYQTQRDRERRTSKIVFIGKRLMLMPNCIFSTLLISE